jgi:hypothetical protein
MAAFLSTFLPAFLQAQYWFINGNQAYFELEDIFTFHDFVYIDQYNSYYLEKEVIKEVYEFLSRIDTKGVNWLLCVPASPIVKIVFCNFHQHSCFDPRNDDIELLIITNYPVKG